MCDKSLLSSQTWNTKVSSALYPPEDFRKLGIIFVNPVFLGSLVASGPKGSYHMRESRLNLKFENALVRYGVCGK